MTRSPCSHQLRDSLWQLHHRVGVGLMTAKGLCKCISLHLALTNMKMLTVELTNLVLQTALLGQRVSTQINSKRE